MKRILLYILLGIWFPSQAGTISTYPSGATPSDTDLFITDQGSPSFATYKVTAAQIKIYAQGGTLLSANNLADIGSVPTALQNLGTILNQVVTESVSFTVTSSQRGKFFNVTTAGSTILATLPSAASAGNGFVVYFRKADTGTGSIQFTPAASPAATSLWVQGHTCMMYSDGTNWYARDFYGGFDGSGNLTISTGNNGNINFNPNGAGVVQIGGNQALTTVSALNGGNLTSATVTNAKLATMAANTIKANATGSTAAPTDALANTVLSIPRMGIDANGTALLTNPGAYQGQLALDKDGSMGWWNGSNWTSTLAPLFGFAIAPPGTTPCIQENAERTDGGYSNLLQATQIISTGSAFTNNVLSIGNFTPGAFAALAYRDVFSPDTNGYIAMGITGNSTSTTDTTFQHNFYFPSSGPLTGFTSTSLVNQINEPNLAFGENSVPGVFCPQIEIRYKDPLTRYTSATTTSGSTTMTVTGSTSGLSAISGGWVYGSGLPATGTSFTISGTTVTLGIACTVTNSTASSYCFSPATPAPPRTVTIYGNSGSGSGYAPGPLGLQVSATGKTAIGTSGSSADPTYVSGVQLTTPSEAITGITSSLFAADSGGRLIKTSFANGSSLGTPTYPGQWFFNIDGSFGYANNGSTWDGANMTALTSIGVVGYVSATGALSTSLAGGLSAPSELFYSNGNLVIQGYTGDNANTQTIRENGTNKSGYYSYGGTTDTLGHVFYSGNYTTDKTQEIAQVVINNNGLKVLSGSGGTTDATIAANSMIGTNGSSHLVAKIAGTDYQAPIIKATGTLSGGTVTISNGAITTASAVSPCHLATSVTNAGPLYVNALSSGSVTIKSTNSSDNDTIVITIQ
jgi:hypothetical protein